MNEHVITVGQRSRYLMDAPYHARVNIVKRAILVAADDVDQGVALACAMGAVEALEVMSRPAMGWLAECPACGESIG